MQEQIYMVPGGLLRAAYGAMQLQASTIRLLTDQVERQAVLVEQLRKDKRRDRGGRFVGGQP